MAIDRVGVWAVVPIALQDGSEEPTEANSLVHRVVQELGIEPCQVSEAGSDALGVKARPWREGICVAAGLDGAYALIDTQVVFFIE